MSVEDFRISFLCVKMTVLWEFFLPPRSHGETALSVSLSWIAPRRQRNLQLNMEICQLGSVELPETPLNYPCISDFNLKYIFLAIVVDL